MHSFKSLVPLNSKEKDGRVSPDKSPVFIDYLTLLISNINDHATYLMWVNNHLKSFGLTISKRRAAIPIGYDIAYQICTVSDENDVCGSIKYSVKLSRFLFELTGRGCSMAEKYDSFTWIRSIVFQNNVKIKRIDLAVDDYTGLFKIEKVDRAHSRGNCNSITGRRPMKRNVGNKKQGRTRYIGGPTAYKQACIYEKAKQLGINHEEFIDWVRAEVRFNSNSRDLIPKEILDYKTDYFFSAYPKLFHSLVNSAKYYPPVFRESLEYAANLGRSAMYSRHQYGRINQALVNVVGEKEAIALLTRPGKSKKLKRLPFIQDEYIKEKFSELLIDITTQKPSK